MGDLLFSLIVLANSLNIDLNDALNLVLRKYEKRFKKKAL
jgi:NTP pyrophosphatase (non-canonical NTP hydrolase)